MNDALVSYTANAGTLIDLYQRRAAVTPLIAPMERILPVPPARVLDVGAGPGRDAAWFAARGYHVTAVEPVPAFRRAGQRRYGPGIRWRAEALPELAHHLSADLIWVRGVWQHLPPSAQCAALVRLGGALRPGGRLVLALRDGPAPEGRGDYALDLLRLRRCAIQSGLAPIWSTCRASVGAWNRAHGVRWHWLVLGRSRRI